MTKKTSVFALIIAVAAIGLLTSSASVSNEANGQSTVTVPSWIQQVAGFWSSGDVSDGEFVNAMTFLVEEGIMDLPNVLSPAEAQTITSSLEEMDQRLEKVESQQTTTGTIAPTPDIPEEPPEDSTYPYVFAVCPSDKIRHFDKVLYEFTPIDTYLGTPKISCPGTTLYQNELGVIILEEHHDEIKKQINIKTKLVEQLKINGCSVNEEGVNLLGKDIVDWDITIIDVDYAVICANKPGVSGSGDTLGYK